MDPAIKFTMPPRTADSLPYLTRDMLAFENGLTFALRVDMQADTVATLALRGMTRESTFEYKATTAATSLITSATYALSDIPIYVTIEDVNRSLVQGAAFVTISILANGVVVQQLLSGYLYGQKALSWPNTQQVDLRPGGGRIQRVLPTTPAANVDIQITVPTGETWKIRDITFLLTTSSAAANRRCKIYISTPHDATLWMWADSDQVASKTYIYHGGNIGAGSAGIVGSDVFIPIPSDMLLFAGDTLGMTCTNRQAADQMTPDEITIEKYFTTP